MSEYKLINVRLFDPALKSVKQRCEYTYCNNSDNCALYKQRKCVHEYRYLDYTQCPYGRYGKSEGYTRKAKSFKSWFDKKREQHGELVDYIEIYAKKLAVIGDYVYLPYPYLKSYVNSMDGIINKYFIKREDFTVEKIMSLVNYKPEALMGGTIREFQNKYVPRFLQHLKEALPDIYDKFIKAYPEEAERLIRISGNYIGRTAYINTLQADVWISCSRKNIYLYDGEYLVCEDYRESFMPFGTDTAFLKIKVNDKMTVKISNNAQVGENTIFAD